MAENKIRVTANDVANTLNNGYPITCASCVHFHEARLKNAPNCGKDCGGPLTGGSFPDYKGQIPRDKFDKICLMCGDFKIVCHVVSSQKFGLCEKHRNTFDGFVFDPMLEIPQVTPIIIPLNNF